jgi:hypothetical protein
MFSPILLLPGALEIKNGAPGAIPTRDLPLRSPIGPVFSYLRGLSNAFTTARHVTSRLPMLSLDCSFDALKG